MRREGVNVHEAWKLSGIRVSHHIATTCVAGRVHENINAAESLHDLLDEILHMIGVLDASLYCHTLAPA
jgi:hypothetical protein